MTYSILALDPAAALTVMSEWMDEDEDEDEERGRPFEISGNVPLQQEGAAGEEDVEEAEREERVVVPVLAVTKKVISTVSMGSTDPISAVVDVELDNHDRERGTETERPGLKKEKNWKACRLE